MQALRPGDPMRLTFHTDYALRMLLYLGTRPDQTVTISEVADAYGVSKNHLMKVATHLVSGGYVAATRGNGGGLRLAQKPADIVIGEVVRHTENDFDLVGCFEAGGSCRIEPACLLRTSLRKALDAFFRVLDDYTLADLLVTRPLMAELFQLTEPAETAANSILGKRRAW
jgi:Rrf2 family nitric oxide-sensitive transcriptional repressor